MTALTLDEEEVRLVRNVVESLVYQNGRSLLQERVLQEEDPRLQLVWEKLGFTTPGGKPDPLQDHWAHRVVDLAKWRGAGGFDVEARQKVWDRIRSLRWNLYLTIRKNTHELAYSEVNEMMAVVAAVLVEMDIEDMNEEESNGRPGATSGPSDAG